MKKWSSFFKIQSSFQRRIIFILLSVILLYGVLLIFSTYQLIRTIQTNESAYHKNIQKKNNYLLMKETTLSQINMILMYMYTEDSTHILEIDEIKKEMENKQNEILLQATPTERPLVEKFVALNDDFSFLLRDQIIPVYQYGNHREAFTLLNEEAKPISLKLVQTANKLVSDIEKDVDKNSQELIEIGKKRIEFLFWVLIGAVILVILVSVYISTKVTKPLLILLEAVRKMSVGDFHVKVKLGQTEGEFTELGNAFNQMSGNIKDLMEEQETAKRKLKVESEKAKELNRLQSQFLANMSHELRTPLTVIIGFAELLKENTKDATNDFSCRILKSAEHLLTLINDLLDLAKVESGKMELIYKQNDITELINESIKTIEVTAKEKNVQVEKNITIDSAWLLSDRTKIRQVLLNLLSNAIKFSHQNSKIQIGLIKEGDYFIINVKDQGIGISENKLERIFDRFYQVDGGLERRYEGTGLGLPLTKELVKLHNGTIKVKSEEGVGSEFFVYLPYVTDHSLPIPNKKQGSLIAS